LTCPVPFSTAAWIIAKMPARIASGSAGQASITAARSEGIAAGPEAQGKRKRSVI
jgi:hypothetical protein